MPPEERQEKIHLDYDTRGVAGSPDIFNTILKKIQESCVFVGDMTIVGRVKDATLPLPSSRDIM